ncbi:MAG: hypothetical protein FE78DRAFT_487511 [Acidomyces sp. 'richmondensis']|nr:MAG: hypothetical protein FE78DRAFT_487511 [Acidomyces sp. 'richmondensis']
MLRQCMHGRYFKKEKVAKPSHSPRPSTHEFLIGLLISPYHPFPSPSLSHLPPKPPMNDLAPFYRAENMAPSSSTLNDFVPLFYPDEMAALRRRSFKEERCDSGVYLLDDVPRFDLIEWSVETIAEIRAVLKEAERPNGFDDLEIARRVHKLRVERAVEAEKARETRDREVEHSRQPAVQQKAVGESDDVVPATQHRERAAGKDEEGDDDDDDDDDRTIRANSLKHAAKEKLVGRVMGRLSRRHESM